MSNTPARATSSFSTVKRSACDRCRGQKLRCPQREDPSTPCTRCTRLGAQCVTSYSKPPGRTAKGHGDGALSNSQFRPELRPKATPPPTAGSTTPCTVPGGVTAPPVRVGSASSHPTRPTHSSRNSDFSAATTLSALSAQAGAAAFPQPETNDALFFSPSQTIASLQQDDFMFLDDAPQEDLSDLVSNDFDSHYYLPELSEYGTGSGSDGHSASSANCSEPPRVVSRPTSVVFEREASHAVLECDARLSRLSLDLSKRHEQCLTMLTAMRHGGPQSLGGGEEPASPNLFEHAVRDLSEFLAIVQLYSPKKDRHNSISADGVINGRGLNPRPRRRVGVVVLLDLLSGYLQIVAIYEKIFRCLKTWIARHPGGVSDNEQQTLLGLKLNGFPAELQTKMLIHAILHQFDEIERILGLPADLRVTGQSGVYHGLFEDDGARALLGAVSNANGAGSSWGQLAVHDHLCHQGSNTLAILREAIKDVQTTLNGW